MVLLSYIPLLMAEGGEEFNLADIPKEFSDNLGNCGSTINACIWIGGEDGKPMPVFIVKKAKEIVEHMSMWTENDIAGWFKLYFREIGGKYGIVLFPNINKSIERYKQAYLHHHGEFFPENKRIGNVVTRPLTFISSKEHIFGRVKENIGTHTKVGFLERGLKQNLSNFSAADLNINDVHMIGPIEVKWATGATDIRLEKYLDPLIRKANNKPQK